MIFGTQNSTDETFSSTRTLRFFLPFLLAVLVIVTSCKQNESRVRPGVLTVAQEQQSSWVRNFHPFLPMGVARWGTSAGQGHGWGIGVDNDR